MTPSDRQPVRLRVYGILAVTRKGYVRLQTVGLGICSIMILVGLAVILWTNQWSPSHQLPQQGSVALWFVKQFLILLFWVGLVLLPLDILEMTVMLRKFARAEAHLNIQDPMAEREHSPAPSPMAQANTSSTQQP